MDNDNLAHFGVKGMRWGVRKDEPAHEDSARATSAATKAKTGGVHTLSNEELRKLNERLNLEQQYSSLSSNKTTVNRGNSKVKQLLKLGQTANEVNTFAGSPAGKAIKKTIARKVATAAVAAVI